MNEFQPSKNETIKIERNFITFWGIDEINNMVPLRFKSNDRACK